MKSFTLTNADVAKGPPGSIIPLSVKFSPRGDLLTYLYPGNNGKRQIFSVSLRPESSDFTPKTMLDLTDSMSSTLSLQEQLRRERMRLFTEGVASYEWIKGADPSKDFVVVPMNGQVYSFCNEKVRCIYDGKAGEAVDPQVAPNGKLVAFVINGDLYVHPILDEEQAGVEVSPIRLTTSGELPGISCGLADYLAQEEMDRYRGFWWSPDSTKIAYCVNDESSIPEFCIMNQCSDDPSTCEKHRYPFAGCRNPRVQLAVVDLYSGGSNETVPLSGEPRSGLAPSKPTWMNLVDSETPGVIDPEDFYLCRVDWWVDGSVMAQVENREQTVLQLLRLDPMTGNRVLLLQETSSFWINLHDMFHPLSATWNPPVDEGAEESGVGSFYFIWSSERSGFCQPYLYRYTCGARSADCLLNNTPIGGGGEWVVESFDGVDEANAILYFSGNKDCSTERHLFRASFWGSATDSVERLTTTPGWHAATVDASTGFVVDVHSSAAAPPLTALFKLQSSAVLGSTGGEALLVKSILHDNSRDSTSFQEMSPALQIPKILSCKSSDGATDLVFATYVPDPTIFGNGPHPAIVSVYGGPHVQWVTNQWRLRADLRAQKLANSGYVVIKCDNRGSARRGIQFESGLHRDMGNVEVLDQVAAVEAVAKTGLIDRQRVGIFGWSYGGYMSAMSLCRAPEIFSCAVAGAPVTSWDGYDTCYTERYMGTPQNNEKGYIDSSVMTHVHEMTGRLLLVHGLIDENVHFRHTARLIHKLIEERKSYDLILFPGERHSPHRLEDRVYMEDKIFDFFETYLMNK